MRNVRATREDGELYLANLFLISRSFAHDVNLLREEHKMYPRQGIWLSGKNYLDRKNGFLFNDGRISKVQPYYPLSIFNLSKKYFIPEHLYGLVSDYAGFGECPDFLKVYFSYDLLANEEAMIVKLPRNISTSQKREAQNYITTNPFLKFYETNNPPELISKKGSIQAKKKTDSTVTLKASLSVGREKFGKAVQKNKVRNFKLDDHTFDRSLEAYRMVLNGENFDEIYKSLFTDHPTSYTTHDIKKWVKKISRMIEGLTLIKAKKMTIR